jgi:hypothetical protein
MSIHADKNINPLSKLHEGEPYFFACGGGIGCFVGVLDAKVKAECVLFADRMEKWQDENADNVTQPD